MRRPMLRVTLSIAAVAVGLGTAAVATASDGECDILLRSADRLDKTFNMVSASGTPPSVAGQIRSALAPLFGLSGAAAVDLRLWSGAVASDIDGSDPYRLTAPGQLTSDLGRARHQLTVARQYCMA
ncbi:hypothetical protein [Mycobacterium sp. IS-1556]|uniref:hypothetical protein n=1 Tax=Mycobacterium sp. IS-1556 TaxID=1772276 RepID=UPI0012E380BB|nr:hypothetical protein [Mycobacterium sp. IS-1556]